MSVVHNSNDRGVSLLLWLCRIYFQRGTRARGAMLNARIGGFEVPHAVVLGFIPPSVT